jgi:hypothetical protein
MQPGPLGPGIAVSVVLANECGGLTWIGTAAGQPAPSTPARSSCGSSSHSGSLYYAYAFTENHTKVNRQAPAPERWMENAGTGR